MSWSVNFVAKAKGAAVRYVEGQQAANKAYFPVEAKDSVVAAIEGMAPVPEDAVLHVCASGHVDSHWGTSSCQLSVVRFVGG